MRNNLKEGKEGRMTGSISSIRFTKKKKNQPKKSCSKRWKSPVSRIKVLQRSDHLVRLLSQLLIHPRMWHHHRPHLRRLRRLNSIWSVFKNQNIFWGSWLRRCGEPGAGQLEDLRGGFPLFDGWVIALDDGVEEGEELLVTGGFEVKVSAVGASAHCDGDVVRVEVAQESLNTWRGRRKG